MNAQEIIDGKCLCGCGGETKTYRNGFRKFINGHQIRRTQTNNEKKYCIKCNEELVVGKNWYSSNEKHRGYTCKSCVLKQSRENSWKKGVKERIPWNGKCKKCGNDMMVGINCGSKSINGHICNVCITDNHRKTLIGTTDTTGKKITIKCIKRKHTLICELCNNKVKTTHYHHWDDEHPENGMWICYPCHTFVEGIERGLSIDNYCKLKKKIEDDNI